MSYAAKYVAEGFMLFVEREMLPTLSGWKVWAGAAALALVGKNAETILMSATQNPALSAMGIADKDGLVNAETAVEAIKAAIRKHGKMPVHIPLLDTEFMFSEKDADTLLEYIKQAAGVSD